MPVTETPRITAPLPSFQPAEPPPRSQPLDPRLPETEGNQPLTDQDSNPRFGPELPKLATPEAPTGNSSDGAKKPRWAASGNPEDIGKVLAGLLIIGTGWLALTAARRGAKLRRPTESEMDDITLPIGKILCRRFPMAAIGPDLVDGLSSLVAVNKYVERGPLLTAAGSADEGTN